MDKAGDAPTKKQYGEPALVSYGSIGKLTQTQSGTGTDGGAAGMSLMMCL